MFRQIFRLVSRISIKNSRYGKYSVPNESLKFVPQLINVKMTQVFERSTKINPIWAVAILTWLGFVDEDGNKESELITTLKRAVLCTMREQYKKAEQLLHIALRLAQQQQNRQGEIYCFDLMANLALQQLQLDKAEKLFVTVLQMLLGEGTKQDDLKVIHISLKLARICEMKLDMDKAEIGFQWCFEKIENQKNDSPDAQMLYGVINDWYAQFLIDKGENMEKVLKHLNEAYEICEKIEGKYAEKSMLLLNDLAVVSFKAGLVKDAETYLMRGISIGEGLEDQTHHGVLHANLGLVFLEKGIIAAAKKYCGEARRLGKENSNLQTVEQANYCFDQIKLHQKS